MKTAMRWGAAVAALLLFLPACTTSTATGNPDVELRIAQLPDDGFAVEDRGAVSVGFQMTIRNRLADPITLRKFEMRTVGNSPYALRNEPVTMSEVIAPGEERVVPFTMWSYASGQRSETRKTVWVSGIVYFDGAKGALKKEFTQSFREP